MKQGMQRSNKIIIKSKNECDRAPDTPGTLSASAIQNHQISYKSSLFPFPYELHTFYNTIFPAFFELKFPSFSTFSSSHHDFSVNSKQKQRANSLHLDPARKIQHDKRTLYQQDHRSQNQLHRVKLHRDQLVRTDSTHGEQHHITDHGSDRRTILYPRGDGIKIRFSTMFVVLPKRCPEIQITPLFHHVNSPQECHQAENYTADTQSIGTYCHTE